MKILVVLNDPPYGTELCYNGLRLARSLAQQPGIELKVFLLGDAAACGKAKQITPSGYYNLERMLGSLGRANVEIGACGTCMDARGIAAEDLAQGVRRGTLDDLTSWTVWADKVLVF